MSGRHTRRGLQEAKKAKTAKMEKTESDKSQRKMKTKKAIFPNCTLENECLTSAVQGENEHLNEFTKPLVAFICPLSSQR